MVPSDFSVDTNHHVQSNGTSIRNIFPLLVLVPPACLGGQVCGLMPVSRSTSLLHLVRFGASSSCVPTSLSYLGMDPSRSGEGTRSSKAARHGDSMLCCFPYSFAGFSITFRPLIVFLYLDPTTDIHCYCHCNHDPGLHVLRIHPLRIPFIPCLSFANASFFRPSYDWCIHVGRKDVYREGHRLTSILCALSLFPPHHLVVHIETYTTTL